MLIKHDFLFPLSLHLDVIMFLLLVNALPCTVPTLGLLHRRAFLRLSLTDGSRLQFGPRHLAIDPTVPRMEAAAAAARRGLGIVPWLPEDFRGRGGFREESAPVVVHHVVIFFVTVVVSGEARRVRDAQHVVIFGEVNVRQK